MGSDTGMSNNLQDAPDNDPLPPLPPPTSLEAERQRLYDLFMQAPATVLILRGPDLVIELINRPALQVWQQKSSDDLLNRPLFAAIPELVGQPIEKILRDVLATGEAFHGNELYLPLDRNDDGVLEDGYFTFVYAPLRDAEQNVDGIMVFAYEVTDQVMARQQAEASEQRLETILESISDGFVAYDRDWRYIYANEKAAQVVERKKEEILGKTLGELFPDRVALPIFQEFQKIMDEGKPAQIEYFSPGAQRWLRTNFYPSEEGMTTFFTDITEQKLAQQKVEESEAKYRTLFETMDQGFCILEMIFDPANHPVDYLFLEINPIFEQQTGLKNAVGRTARQLVPDLEAHWFEIYGKVALTGEAIRFIEGSAAMGRWFEVYAFRLGDADSRKVALLFTEITERRKAEAERAELAVVQERHRLARELHDAVTQSLFAASVITETLPRLWERKPELAFNQLDALHRLIKGASAEMRTLLWELRPENIVQNNFTELFTQLAAAAQSRSHVQVAVRVHDPIAQPVPADTLVVFYRIAQESINNIIKHAHATRLQLTLKRTPDYLALVIADNGRGFDTSTTRSGLGLTIMQERAATIGATVSVKSRLGRGTRIRLVWPS